MKKRAYAANAIRKMDGEKQDILFMMHSVKDNVLFLSRYFPV